MLGVQILLPELIDCRMCKNCPTSIASDRHNQQKRLYASKARVRNKQLVLDAYGGVCKCCGEEEAAFLVVDHIDNDGARHREEIGRGRRKIGSGSVIHEWLVRNQFPPGFQLLCANCNTAKASLGYCPHVDVAQSG